MTGKRRRSSESTLSAAYDVSLQNTIRRADRGLVIRPPEPGTHADAYYRNLYSTEPDFGKLGRQDPLFGAMCVISSLDFALARLTDFFPQAQTWES